MLLERMGDRDDLTTPPTGLDDAPQQDITTPPSVLGNAP